MNENTSTSNTPDCNSKLHVNSSFSESEMDKVLQASWIAKDGTLYASSFNTIYKSADNGETCKQLKAFDCKGLDSIFVNKENSVFVSPGLDASASDAGLWRSINGGITWNRVLSLSLSCSIWAIDEDSKGRLFAGIYTRGQTKNARIYRSDDFGASWRSIFFDSKARHIHFVTVDKATDNIYASVGDKSVPESNVAYVLRSVDGGNNWKRILKHIPQIVAIKTIRGERLFGTDDVGNGELYRTTDDKKFCKVLDTGAHSCCFWIRQDEVSGRIYASFVSGEAAKKTSGIYVSDDNGLTWSVYRSFKTNLPYEGSSRSSNFCNGIMYFSVRLEGSQKNGVKVFKQSEIV